jgi:hypothetical protein
MTLTTRVCALLGISSTLAHASSYRTVGSSGCAAQMIFVPPYTDTVVFLDKYVNGDVHWLNCADEI